MSIKPLVEWLCANVFGGHKIYYAQHMGYSTEAKTIEIGVECERCGNVRILDRESYERIFYKGRQ